MFKSGDAAQLVSVLPRLGPTNLQCCQAPTEMRTERDVQWLVTVWCPQSGPSLATGGLQAGPALPPPGRLL